jgi:hypothetical protein
MGVPLAAVDAESEAEEESAEPGDVPPIGSVAESS